MIPSLPLLSCKSSVSLKENPHRKKTLKITTLTIYSQPCHLLISSNENITVKIGQYEIPNSECEELLGVRLDWKLNCDDHISNRCKNACGELNALVRIASFIGLSKRRILMNNCFNSQFSYCPLIWMCHSRTNNRKTKRFHERCSRFIYNDKKT